MTDLLYGLAVVGAVALGAGGLWGWHRDRRRALLLIAAGVVTLINVISWSTLPGLPGVAAPAAG